MGEKIIFRCEYFFLIHANSIYNLSKIYLGGVGMLLTSLLRVILTRSLKPFIFEGKYQNKLEFENLDDLGLYVHIPFCRTLCDFCPYCKEKYN
jgi:hypothetical protein